MRQIIVVLMIFVSSAAADTANKLSMIEGEWEVTGNITMQSSNGAKQTGPAQPSECDESRRLRSYCTPDGVRALL
jgi:hypothetical protein